jgi:hypothetical protein
VTDIFGDARLWQSGNSAKKETHPCANWKISMLGREGYIYQ